MWFWPAWVIQHPRSLDSRSGMKSNIVSCQQFENRTYLPLILKTMVPYLVFVRFSLIRKLILAHILQVRAICKDFGIVCIRREGKDVQKLISSSETLQECRVKLLAWGAYYSNEVWKFTHADVSIYIFQDNIFPVDEIVPNQISSSRVRYNFIYVCLCIIWCCVVVSSTYFWSNYRECIRRCLSIKYLICDEVIEYIREHKLYTEAEESDTRSWLW